MFTKTSFHLPAIVGKELIRERMSTPFPSSLSETHSVGMKLQMS